MSEDNTITHAGFVALVGAPNAGKSTLVNQLAGTNLTIVHRKAQTTRSRFRAIVSYQNCQVILVDTPGLFTPKDSFDKAMVETALSSAADADMVWLIIDAAAKNATQVATRLLETLHKQGVSNQKKAILLNKTDQMPKEKLLPLTANIHEILADDKNDSGDIFMISALKGDGCGELLAHAKKAMPESAALYPEDYLTDSPLWLMVAEITRLHIFERMHQEIPYQIAVETTSWEAQKDGSIKIEQMIYVGRESFKGMVLGKGGQKIKEISMGARTEITSLVNEKVHLMLRVKYQENWRNQKQFRVMQGLE